MIATLNIYGNCASLEPTKVYTLYRMTPYLLGALQDFIQKRFGDKTPTAEDYNGVEESDITNDAQRLLQIFFPEITKEELYMIDYGDGTGNNGQFFEFVKAIADYGNREAQRAVKN